MLCQHKGCWVRRTGGKLMKNYSLSSRNRGEYVCEELLRADRIQDCEQTWLALWPRGESEVYSSLLTAQVFANHINVVLFRKLWQTTKIKIDQYIYKQLLQVGSECNILQDMQCPTGHATFHRHIMMKDATRYGLYEKVGIFLTLTKLSSLILALCLSCH